MDTTRKKITFSLSQETIEALKRGSEVDGRNLSRYAEAILADFLKVKPKPIKKPFKPANTEDWNKLHDPVNFD